MKLTTEQLNQLIQLAEDINLQLQDAKNDIYISELTGDETLTDLAVLEQSMQDLCDITRTLDEERIIDDFASSQISIQG